MGGVAGAAALDEGTASFACLDWAERLQKGASLIPDALRAAIDWNRADRAVAIFNRLRLPDVPGQPTMAEAAGEWQRDIVRVLFGTIDPATRERLLREIFALVPKKNAKTTGGAAIMVTALLMNERPRAEFVLVGPTQEVADTAFQQAAGMIDADDFLRTRFHVAEHTKTIRDELSNARLKIKTFDMKVATGSKPAGILLDELHLMASMADASRVIGQLRGGMIANPEAFLVIITTQSDRIPAGAFKSELEYARGIRDGRIVEDVATLPLLYEFPEAMQRSGAWRDPATWRMVLPNAGLSITVERLIAEHRTAREKGDEEERRWASQHLNIQMGVGMQDGGWIGARYWPRQADATLTLETLIARSEVIVAGGDAGGLDDLYGLGLVGRCRDTRKWLSWCRAWAHTGVWALRPAIAPTLDDLVARGELVRFADAGEEVADIADILLRVKEAGLFPEKQAIGLDPAGIGELIDELIGRGFDDEQLVNVSQGFRLSPAIWAVERKLSDGTFLHADQALMDWSATNVRIEPRGEAVAMVKAVEGVAKIDPVVAMMNAAFLMSRNPVASGSGGSINDWLASLAA